MTCASFVSGCQVHHGKIVEVPFANETRSWSGTGALFLWVNLVTQLMWIYSPVSWEEQFLLYPHDQRSLPKLDETWDVLLCFWGPTGVQLVQLCRRQWLCGTRHSAWRGSFCVSVELTAVAKEVPPEGYDGFPQDMKAFLFNIFLVKLFFVVCVFYSHGEFAYYDILFEY